MNQLGLPTPTCPAMGEAGLAMEGGKGVKVLRVLVCCELVGQRRAGALEVRVEWEGGGGRRAEWVVVVLVCACGGSTSGCRPSQYNESGVYVCACGSTCRFGSKKGALMLAAGAWTSARRGCCPYPSGAAIHRAAGMCAKGSSGRRVRGWAWHLAELVATLGYVVRERSERHPAHGARTARRGGCIGGGDGGGADKWGWGGGTASGAAAHLPMIPCERHLPAWPVWSRWTLLSQLLPRKEKEGALCQSESM